MKRRWKRLWISTRGKHGPAEGQDGRPDGLFREITREDVYDLVYLRAGLEVSRDGRLVNDHHGG
jgi:hypothetical protein